MTPLSERQIEVLELLIKGLTHGEIASRLNISERGVRFILDSAAERLGVRSRAALVSQFTLLHLVKAELPEVTLEPGIPSCVNKGV